MARSRHPRSAQPLKTKPAKRTASPAGRGGREQPQTPLHSGAFGPALLSGAKLSGATPLSRWPHSRFARRTSAPVSDHLRDLLDDDQVGGLLARIRAVGCLIGAAADVDPAQINAAGWLIEALAEKAQSRLREAVRRLPVSKTGRVRHRSGRR